MWAVKPGKIRAIQLLLEHRGVDVNMVDHEGKSALTWAANEGDNRSAELLLARGEVNPDLTNIDGRTPLS